MELLSFSIPTYKKEDLQKRLQKLVKKAHKYGNTDILFSFGDKPFLAEVETEVGKRKIEYVRVFISGEAPQIAGWDLLGRVELMEGENLIHRVPGSNEELSGEFRHHNGHCDHCNTDRPRKDVYILSDGEKQIAVGRTCLRDFLGIDDPKHIVERAQFFKELKGFEDNLDGGDFKTSGFFVLDDVLLRSAAFIRRDGYISKAKQKETGYTTTSQAVMMSIRGNKAYQIETTPNDLEWVEKTISLFRETEFFDNDYMDNLRVILKQDIVHEKHMGLAASSVLAAQRYLSPKEENTKSSYIGEVKQRLRDLKLRLEKLMLVGQGQYGPNYMYLFRDGEGNKFVWFSGNKLDMIEGSTYFFDATVKDHREYHGEKQTVLTRAKQLERVKA